MAARFAADSFDCPFASLSWLGLFALMPRWLHLGVLRLFGLAGIVALYLPFRFRLPDDEAITARIEDVNGLIHEPLAVQTGQMATGANDPFAIALWQEHQRRMAERLKTCNPAFHVRIFLNATPMHCALSWLCCL